MAVYGRYQYNDWFAGARAGYGQSAASVERHLPGLGLTANSRPDIDYYSAALSTGYAPAPTPSTKRARATLT